MVEEEATRRSRKQTTQTSSREKVHIGVKGKPDRLRASAIVEMLFRSEVPAGAAGV